MNENLLTLNRLAQRLKIPAKWLRAEADAGRIPCLKIGCRYYFNVPAVLEAISILAANTRQAVAQ
jgi:hypothetical protein